jgi:sterol 3beta-glucosyltransferase
MRILIVTFGSRGDVQPYVALGKGLQRAGHEVTLCTAEQFESFISENGLNYGYMTGELLKLVDTDAGREALEETTGIFGAAKTMIKLSRAATPLNRQMMIDSWQTALDVEPEIVIYHPKALGGPSIAERFGAPAFMAVLQPMYVPTTEFSLVGVPALPLGGWYNKLTYKAVPMGYRMYAKVINEIRTEQMGLGKLVHAADIFHLADGAPIPILHGFSAQLIPRPDDWPENAHITGYWFLEQDEEWQPPQELEDFMAAGEAPVYVGFGSMAGKDPARLTKIVVQAAQQAGVRAVLATGWGGLETGSLPQSIYAIEKAPHDWLFPRVAAVVHHGGAGTTATGLLAGRPTLICPFMGDQPFWGARVEAMGAGPAPIPQKKLTAEKLAAALHDMLTDANMRRKAEAVGERMRSEDGVQSAVRIIEAVGKMY